MTKKAQIMSHCLVLRTTKNPPAMTSGSSGAEPTHQVADCPRANEVSTTAKAAGLKRCRRRNATTYLQAVERIAAHARKPRLEKVPVGLIMSARMSAVI